MKPKGKAGRQYEYKHLAGWSQGKRKRYSEALATGEEEVLEGECTCDEDTFCPAHRIIQLRKEMDGLGEGHLPGNKFAKDWNKNKLKDKLNGREEEQKDFGEEQDGVEGAERKT